MSKLKGGVLLTVVLLAGCAVTGGWQPVRDSKAVQVYLREHPNSPIPEFRAVTTFNASLGRVVSILTDFGAWSDWVYGYRHAEILQTIGYTEAYIYQIIDLPIVRDRDMLMHAELRRRDESNEVIIEVESAPHYCDNSQRSACRAPNESDLVRVTELSATFRLKQLDNNQVELVWRQHLEPGGRLPAWLTRLMLARVPVSSLRELRKQVEADTVTK